MQEGQEAGLAFVSFLRASKIPESLWEQLLEKIDRGEVGCRGHLKVVQAEDEFAKVLASSDLLPADDIFILPNVRAATRDEWGRLIAEDPASRQSLAEAIQSGQDAASEAFLANLWKWIRPTMLAGSPSQAVTVFSLESNEALWARHAENPNVAVAALPLAVADAIGGGNSVLHGAVMLWPLRAIKVGEEVLRDHFPGPRSLQRAASLLFLLGEPGRWAHEAEYQGLRAAVDASLAGTVPPGVALTPNKAPAQDQRSPLPQALSGKQMSLWTDYPLVKENLTSSAFSLAEDKDAADVLFTSSPIRNFLSLPSNQLVNQFPYEACIIRKDLLPQILRRFHAEAISADAQAAAPSGQADDWVPSFYPATYDLVTEVQFFLQDYKERKDRGQDNHWVVKLAQGSRSTDVCLTDSAELVVRYREAPGGDRVVQKYIENPLLFKGRKMDLRVYLVVRSFEDADAYLYRQWYARVANKEYPSDIDTTETDFERHFTVACYHADPAVSSAQLMVSKNEVVKQLEEQGVDVADLEEQLCSMARDLVNAAQHQIGSWPRSRAVYGLDVLLAHGAAGKCCPQLLEVNFCPDFTTLLRPEMEAQEAIDDLLLTCFSSKHVSGRFHRLDQEPEESVPGLKELNAID